MKSNTPEPAKHPEELLMLYVENMLAPDEKNQVETHLSECAECSARVRALLDIVAALKDAREIFCPEPWEIYEFVEKGKPEGAVSEHFGLCNSCRAQAVQYEMTPTERMPAELWNRIQERLPKASEPRVLELDKAPGVMEWLHRWFKLPKVAVAAAVAAMLVVLVLYPREPIEYGVGLTSVTWDGALRPKTIQKAAVLLMFKDMKPPLSQARIDSLYESLKPDIDVSSMFGMVSPAVLSAAIKNHEIAADNEKRLLSSLYDKFNVSVAVLVDLTRKGDAFNVRVNMVDADSGKTLRTAKLSDVPDDRLNEQVREAVKSLLLRDK